MARMPEVHTAVGAAADATAGSIPGGDYLGYFREPSSQARKGRYVLHVPQRAMQPAPLVVVLHGVSNTAASMAAKTRLNELSERHGFLVLYPEGLGFLGRWQHWNAGFCCGLAHEREVDDSAFVRRCIKDVQDRLQVDAGRVYLVGHSNGAMLAYALAAEHPQGFRAIAVVAGTAGGTAAPGEPLQRVTPAGPPVPLLAIHGGEDHVIPVNGGASSDPFLAQYGERLSLQDSLGLWLRHNRCTEDPTEQQRFAGRVLQRDWCKGRSRSAVRLLLMRHWPHAWPGLGAGPVPGYSLPHGFDAGAEVWNFFEEQEE